MSVITLEQFPQFVEDNPEMEQCYGSLLDMHMDNGMDWDEWEANLERVAEAFGITTDELIDMELNGEVQYAA